MSSIKFILRLGKKKANQEYPIYLQYKHQENKILIATGKKCEPRHWDKKKGKPRNEDSLEDWLDAFKRKFRANTINIIEGEPIAETVKAAWQEYQRKQADSVPEAALKNTLLARWDNYLTFLDETLYKGKKRTKGTVRNNANTRNLFAKYLDVKKIRTVKPEAFTLIDFQKFEHWLVNDTHAWVVAPTNKGEAKTKLPNGVAKTLKQFKSFLKWHIKHGGSIGFNIDHIEYGETAGVKISLTEKELLTIAQTDFKENNTYRDLMLLQASTGVRISDLQRLCDNLNEEKTAFKIKTKKVGKPVLIPVLPLAHQVLKRHNYKVPRVPEQYYRQGIKDIYKALWPSKTIEVGQGDNQRRVLVWQEISSHDMVRTFVDISAKKGITVPTIATITGKSIQVLLKNYLSEDRDHAAKEVMEKFDISPLRIAQ